jgi:hypothetical protein
VANLSVHLNRSQKLGPIVREVGMRLGLAAITFSAVVATFLPAAAQVQRNYLQPRPTTISVQYQLRLPLKSGDVAEQERVMEEGRKQLYLMGSKECAAILATLASSCALTDFNVQSNQGRSRGDDNTVTMTAGAQYQIELKDAARGDDAKAAAP